VATAFFLSGAAALVYELLWFRMLGHIFGSTATAAATLLAAYLFGLGLGAWIFGRISDRLRRLALAYVLIEAGIGVYGLISHGLLQRGAALYAGAHASAAGDPAKLLALRFAISFLLIVVPTTLMGGTFPLMVHLLRQAAARRRKGGAATREEDAAATGAATARSYAANTAGAAVGAFALPLLLLPQLGIARSLAVAAAANLTAAACAWIYARRAGVGDPAPVPSRAQLAGDPGDPGGVAPEAAPGRASLPWSLLAGFLLSSFAALSLETAWARHFGIFFGTQIHTFAFILCAYLTGLFLGGAAYARFAARGTPAATLLRAGFLIAALSVGVTVPFLDRLPTPQILLMSALGVSNANFMATSALETFALVLPPALGFGLAFPAMVGLLAGRGRRTGASVALAYAVNTLGTTLGAIGSGFWLIPAVGTQRTLELSVLLVAVGLALAAREGRSAAPGPRGRLLAYGVPAAFLLLLALPRWDWRFAHGMYSRDPVTFVQNYRTGELEQAIATWRVSFLDEGTEATVSVLEFGGAGRRSMYINGKPDASNIPDDMVVQRLLGLVPPLFHPDPKDALVIGLGSGTTVASLARYPLARIESAEIAPGVARAAREHFADVNEGIFADPRVSLLLDDGRNYLHFQPDASYDLIISEPSNPWTAGVSALFTDEFFAEAKRKLRPGGVLCQWFHYYNMSFEHIQLIIRTFTRHFPETAVLVAIGERPTGDLLMIGAKDRLQMAYLPDDPALPERVRAAFAEIRNPTAEELLRGLSAGPEDAVTLAGRGPVNTDDRPVLEFEAPADRFEPSFLPNLGALLTATDRTFLPVAVSLPGPFPAGREERRGATVLTRRRADSIELDRWVLLGAEFAAGEERTELFQLARKPKDLEEVRQVARALAGADVAGEGEVALPGHAALWVEGVPEAGRAGGARTVVCAWRCPEEDRALFRTVRTAAPSAPAAIAAQLGSRYPCSHAGRTSMREDRPGAATP